MDEKKAQLMQIELAVTSAALKLLVDDFNSKGHGVTVEEYLEHARRKRAEK
jgi:hypothetical protein